MKKNLFKDPVSRNIGYLSLLVFVLSLQVLIIIVFIYQFIPLKMAPITAGVPTKLLKLFQPNRNHFFYHTFIATAILGQATVLYLFRRRLQQPQLATAIKEFLVCETLWVSWQLFAVFKILQYDNPPWARCLLYAGFAAALLAKIFWPEFKRGLNLFQSWLKGGIYLRWRNLADGGIVLFLFLAIMIPDPQKALLRMAFFDNFNHFDQWLMTPLWAYHKGLTPALQFFYSLNGGVLGLVHALVFFLGGVTYGHVIEVLCFLAVFYYIGFYYFLRSWLGILPAAFGVLLAVKLQMFHLGVSPLIWAFPDQSVLRHLMDVAVFFCLLKYARGGKEFFLWVAASFIGISLGLVFDTGMYMLIALYAYLGSLLSFKESRSLLCASPLQWRKILGLFSLPWLLMVIVLTFCFSPVVSHGEFWAISFRDISQWVGGSDAGSVLSCLRGRNFFAFFASFVPPLIYAVGISTTISMVYFRRWRMERLFLIPLSVYGLGVYGYFLWHSTINGYYMVPLPLVGCICFWATAYLNRFSKNSQCLIKLISSVIAGIALFTNFLFTYYPNVFNMAGVNWEQEKLLYRANFNVDNDADFVHHWTLPGARVALISDFETRILLEADRAPFFYSNMTLMGELDQGKPGQLLVDKRILNVTGNPGIYALMGYLKNNYRYTGQQSNGLILLKSNHE